MHRRVFILGAGAAGLVACAKPERDLLEAYEGVDTPLEPGATPTLEPGEAAPDSVVDTSSSDALSPMEALRESVPVEDRPGLVFVAVAKGATVDVVTQLGDDEVAWTFTNPIASGDELVFLLDDYDGVGSYRVLLPTRPNGSFGWIRADAVDLRQHNLAIRVELDEFRLTVFDHNEPVFTPSVGVARDNAPTPLGQYYTTELLRPAEPDSVYGAFAYGLSGYSDTFTTFSGGPGQLGIHGTNDPSTIGTNVSSGCIRMHNDDITRLVEEFKVTPGVPVEVI